MKAGLFLLTTMMMPLAAIAQNDTLTTQEDRMQSLEIGMAPGNGLHVSMIDGDTVANKGSWTIDTKYKHITITTEPKHWENTSDSIAQVLHDRRVERRNKFTYWSGLDLGVNTLLGADGSTDLPEDAEFMEINNSNSRFFAINFMEQKIEFGNHHVGILTGLGWEFVNYRLKNNVSIQYNADSVYGVPVEDLHYDKNKLRQIGFRVPVMFEFNTKRVPLPTEADVLAMRQDSTGRLAKRFEQDRRRNFHVALGVVGSWYYETMYKVKYDVDGENKKDRDIGDYHVLPYRAAAAVRIGYGALNLFAEYSLTPLFRDGKGPELTPFCVGLTLIGFN